MKIPGTYQEGASNPVETEDVPFYAPAEPLQQYQPTGMSGPIPGTFGEGAGNSNGPVASRMPYAQQPSGASPLSTSSLEGNSPNSWRY